MGSVESEIIENPQNCLGLKESLAENRLNGFINLSDFVEFDYSTPVLLVNRKPE